MTFLCYASLLRSLPSIVKESNYKSEINYPLIPYRISILAGCMRISRLAYQTYISGLKKRYDKSHEKMNEKWCKDINYYRRGSMVNIKAATKNTYIQTFHFRLISRIMATNKFLYTIGKTEDDQCSFCHSAVETLAHLFWECQVTQTFISEIASSLKSSFGLKYSLNKGLWFFPNLDECEKSLVLILSIAKIVIYSARNNRHTPSLQHFFYNLQIEAEKEFHSARLANKVNQYYDKWKELKLLPELSIEDIIRRYRNT